jgi:hypothetical protein
MLQFGSRYVHVTAEVSQEFQNIFNGTMCMCCYNHVKYLHIIFSGMTI